LLFSLLFAVGLVYAAYLELNDSGVLKPKLETVKVSNTAKMDSDELTVHYIDVGQGDSELVLIDGHALLIDAGEKEYGEEVVSYLQNLGITTIDYIIATHPHSDHIGGLPEVIERMEVGAVIVPPIPEDKTPTTRVYERFVDAVIQKECELITAKVGDEYSLAEAEFTILSPADEKDYSDLNDFSVEIRLEYGNTSFLFTGDAEKSAEEDMVNSGYKLLSDVLKVGHHGSKDSSTVEFLAKVKPGAAVIEVGEDNSFGHPTEEALTRLSEYAHTIYRTDIDKTVVLWSDGTQIVRVSG
jgi:beta-lactamase superfamily II metal-dependent hydrolase